MVQIDLSSLSDDLIQAPSYLPLNRYLWTGIKHTSLYGQIIALAGHWEALPGGRCHRGRGWPGLFPGESPGGNRVIPFLFSQKSKSDLGWGFLAVIETGRYKYDDGRPAMDDGRRKPSSFRQSSIVDLLDPGRELPEPGAGWAGEADALGGAG